MSVFPESRLWHFMRIAVDNLHEMSKPIFWKKKRKKNAVNLSSAELPWGVVKVNMRDELTICRVKRKDYLFA